MLRKCITNTGRAAGQVHNQGYVVRLVKLAGFAIHPVITHLLTMVGCENQQCVVPLASVLQPVHQPSHIVVHLAHQSVVTRLQHLVPGGVRVTAVAAAGKVLRQLRMSGLFRFDICLAL